MVLQFQHGVKWQQLLENGPVFNYDIKKYNTKVNKLTGQYVDGILTVRNKIPICEADFHLWLNGKLSL